MAVTCEKAQESGSHSVLESGYLSSSNLVLESWRIPREPLAFNAPKAGSNMSTRMSQKSDGKQIWPLFRVGLPTSNYPIKKS